MKIERTADRITIIDKIVLQYVAVSSYKAKLNEYAYLSTRVR
jgi:hypothetical protein